MSDAAKRPIRFAASEPTFLERGDAAMLARLRNHPDLRKNAYALAFLSPFLVLTFLFFILPAIYTVVISFTSMRSSLAMTFNGVENYIRILTDATMAEIFKNSIVYAALCITFSLILSISLAVITQYFFKGNSLGVFFRILWLIPSLLPSVVYVAFWRYFFGPMDSSFLNGILLGLGAIDEPVSWLTRNAMTVLILITVLGSVSGNMILLSASINAIPQDIFHAAQIDGASEKSVVRRIVIPFLKWPITYITISDTIGYISSYFVIMLLTGGGPLHKTTILPLYAYQMAFEKKYYGFGASVSMLIVILCFVLTLILLKMFDFDEMMKSPRIDF